MWKYRTPDEIYHSELELYHHGVLGMKWGHRKGPVDYKTLSKRKKKKIEKKIYNLHMKASRDFYKNRNNKFIDYYNDMADVMNDGGVNRYNKYMAKKYGKNIYNEQKYIDEYNRIITDIQTRNSDIDSLNFLKNNKNFKKATELGKQYCIEKWSKKIKDIMNETAVLEKEINKKRDYDSWLKTRTGSDRVEID